MQVVVVLEDKRRECPGCLPAVPELVPNELRGGHRIPLGSGLQSYFHLTPSPVITGSLNRDKTYQASSPLTASVKVSAKIYAEMGSGALPGGFQG